MKVLLVIMAMLILIAITCCSNTTKQQDDTVEYVYDGDTFKLTNGRTIRLYEIDCPESKQEYGDIATKYTDSILRASKAILILKLYNDEYDREICIVYVDGQNLSSLLVTNGLAWVYQRYSSEDMFNLYLHARTLKIGIWSTPKPIPPFLYRKQLEL